MNRQVTILTGDPTVSLIAAMELKHEGVLEMAEWVRSHRPECLPDNYDAGVSADDPGARMMRLFPHDGRELVKDPKHEDDPDTGRYRDLTDNELLVELAGRKCYDSFGLKAGKKSNRDYIANTQMYADPRAKAAETLDKVWNRETNRAEAEQALEEAIASAQNTVPHASVLYHAKLSFFIAGVSRRVSHELIRNYIGADRDEEGSPSQESTRYTEHYGHYVAHPYILDVAGGDEAEDKKAELKAFGVSMQRNYEAYLDYVTRQTLYATGAGKKLSTIQRKRILESASPYLSHACETSWVWTTNPGALAKMIKERDNDGADLEFRRLAKKLKRVGVGYAPNLFPQPWMR